MNDAHLIYVAGNPDAYPLEYYDPETQTFEGVIPALLEEFAQERGYTVEYYQPGAADRREDLAQNRQVDLISGCAADETFSNTQGAPIVLFQAAGAEDAPCRVLLTDAAPSSLGTELQSFAAGRSPEEWTGMVLTAAEEGREEAALPATVVIGAFVALAAVLAVLAVLLHRARRRARAAEFAVLADPETGFRNEEALKKHIAEHVAPRSRTLYYLLYFHFELEHLERLSSEERMAEFRRSAAEVLRRHMEFGDVPARAAGGDLMVLHRAENLGAVRRWGTEILEDMRQFFRENGGLRISDAGLGVYPLGEGLRMPGEAIFHARQCAMAACRDQISCKVCGGQKCRACEEERQLLEDFDRGLERDEFQFCLQFFVDSHTFAVVGGEALSRWNHPRKGLLYPGRFVPLLEREDRIGRLDLYSLEKTCAFLQKLDEKGIQDFFISCNFSRRTFSAETFVQSFREVVERYHFVRKLLILEITESERIKTEEEAQMLRNITQIRSLGVRIMFDDFGMGYSTFHDLQEYPMDGLKLDKCLVDNMWTERGRIILNGLVHTGHAMGLTVLAEGVEEDRQVEELRRLHCDVLQGFRFSVPLPAPAAEEKILAERGKKK